MAILKIIVKLLITVILFVFWAEIITDSDYFSLFQVIAFVGFIWLANKEFKENKLVIFAFIIFGAFILNPFYSINLNQNIQDVIYLILAIGLIISTLLDFFIKSEKKDY